MGYHGLDYARVDEFDAILKWIKNEYSSFKCRDNWRRPYLVWEVNSAPGRFYSMVIYYELDSDGHVSVTQNLCVSLPTSNDSILRDRHYIDITSSNCFEQIDKFVKKFKTQHGVK